MSLANTTNVHLTTVLCSRFKKVSVKCRLRHPLRKRTFVQHQPTKKFGFCDFSTAFKVYVIRGRFVKTICSRQILEGSDPDSL